MDNKQSFVSRNPGFDKRIQELITLISFHALTPGFIMPLSCEDAEQRMMRIVCDMHATYVSKDSDYAADGKPMGNLRSSEKIGIEAWRAVLLRMNDKRSRVNSFIAKGSYAIEDEKVTDTLVDYAVYSLLGSVLFEETNDNSIVIHNFVALAFHAIKCKVLHDVGKTYTESESWDQDAWQHAENDFECLANFAVQNSVLAYQV